MFKQSVKWLLWKSGLEVSRAALSESQQALTLRLAALSGTTFVIDVGANEGQFATGFLTYRPETKILSFEPSAEAHAKAVMYSSKYPNWDVYDRVAVGAHAGTVELNIAGNSVSSSLLPMGPIHAEAAPESRYVQKEMVRCAPLDDLVTARLVNDEKIYLKIDTQGYELRVLEGASRTLDHVVAIQTEVSFVELYKGQPLAQDVIRFLEAMNFSVFAFSNGLRHPISKKLLQADIYFIKVSPR